MYDQQLQQLRHEHADSVTDLREHYERERRDLLSQHEADVAQLQDEATQLGQRLYQMSGALDEAQAERDRFADQLEAIESRRADSITVATQSEWLFTEQESKDRCDSSTQTAVDCSDSGVQNSVDIVDACTQATSPTTTDNECQVSVTDVEEVACQIGGSDMCRDQEVQTKAEVDDTILVVDVDCIRCRAVLFNLSTVDALLTSALELNANANGQHTTLAPIGESGVEDVGSSAESVAEDTTAMLMNRHDVQRQRHKVRQARQYLNELIAAISVEESQRQRRSLSPVNNESNDSATVSPVTDNEHAQVRTVHKVVNKTHSYRVRPLSTLTRRQQVVHRYCRRLRDN